MDSLHSERVHGDQVMQTNRSGLFVVRQSPFVVPFSYFVFCWQRAPDPVGEPAPSSRQAEGTRAGQRGRDHDDIWSREERAKELQEHKTVLIS